ncbi:MAG: PIN domain-containing protein [Candidatus Kapaibacteriota bacterium]|jgi:predicted nucleic acid-binding protein
MKVVVDTNIVFSAILNPQSNIGQILLNKDNKLQFYSVNYLLIELNNHKLKLSNLAKIDLNLIEKYIDFFTSKITFIDENEIPELIVIDSFELVKEIDPNDSLFVALAKFKDAKIWSGDKKLINGLLSKNYNNYITTNQILDFLFLF